MDAPRIQYAKTSDGVRIAYYVMGEGPPIVQASNIFGSHLLLVRSIPDFRPSMEALERRYRVARYDSRGSGLSQRESPDFSLAARLLDLESVIERLRLERFALIGGEDGGVTAVAYAVRHPEQVTHLILSNAYACGRDFFHASPTLRARMAIRPITKDEVKFYTLSVASSDFQYSDSGRVKERAALMQASIEPAALLPFRDATHEIDVTDLLPQVRMPTLVICRPHPSGVYAHAKSSEVLASRIPDARLAVLEPWTGPVVDEEWLAAVGEFLGDGAPEEKTGKATERVAKQREETSVFHAILFTDIVSHTEMMQRLGDAKGRAVLREHERITRETLKQHAGAEVKTDGDSFMASFASVSSAVECAVALQRAFAEYSATADEPIVIRIGLNVGEPIEEDGDYFGSAVILGARIKDQAAGGEILVPEAVRHLLSGKPFLFSDRGEIALRGFEDPVRLYEVRWQE